VPSLHGHALVLAAGLALLAAATPATAFTPAGMYGQEWWLEGNAKVEEKQSSSS
jgi:hypothetical protein